jgi:hypothetical protein
MPLCPPPSRFVGSPVRFTLPAGSLLWRVHDASMAANEFDQPRENVFGGGRFDGTAAAPYRFMHVSADPDTAVAEYFLPAFAEQAPHERVVLRRRVEGRRLSALWPVGELNLVRLVSATDLAAVHQDSWLTSSDVRDYPYTREWAATLRSLAPWAHGFVWTSTVDLPRTTMILFEDRCSDKSLTVEERYGKDASTADGVAPWLAETLTRYGVRAPKPTALQPKIFINYRSSLQYEARLVHNELSKKFGEHAVFRDTASIPFGIRFDRVLLSAVRATQLMLSLIGRGWERDADSNGSQRLAQETDWVRREILEALRNKVTIAPVLVGTRDRLDENALPDELLELAFLQYLTLPHDLSEDDVRSMIIKLLRKYPELNDDADLI